MQQRSNPNSIQFSGNVSDIRPSQQVDSLVLSCKGGAASNGKLKGLTRETLAELKVTATVFSFQILGFYRHRPKPPRQQRLVSPCR